MKTSDFDYELPEELIAQTPAEPRDSSFPHEQAVRAAVSARLINRAGFD